MAGIAYAQSAAAPAAGGFASFGQFVPLILIFVVFYFLLIRPQQKRTKEQKEHMSTLSEGSRVMTISGIIGTIKHIGEKQAIIEISPGVELTIDKRAISAGSRGRQPIPGAARYSPGTRT